MNYLSAKSMTNSDMFGICCDNLDSGRYTITDEMLGLSRNGVGSSSSAVTLSSNSVHSSTSPSTAASNAAASGSTTSSSSSSTASAFPGHVTSASQMKSDTLLCRSCALKVMKELIYQFREKDVAKADLPPAVAARPDCWWGRNCRTALCRHAHAEKLNHVCPQTRRN